jgi:hypothetical protein
MGYWPMGFTKEDPDNQMMWGDEPADAVAEAISKIKIAFVRDLGRMPSQREIIEGFKFTTDVLDELAVEPRDAPEADRRQHEVLDEYGYAALAEQEKHRLSPDAQKAMSAVGGVLKELSLPRDQVEIDIDTGEELTPADIAVLKMMAGASFAKGASLTLPSGRTLYGQKLNELIAEYA